MSTESTSTNPSEIHLDDCWAKTDPTLGTPCISVADHCFTVGHVAQTILESLPNHVLKQLPQGATTLVASHDLGKITPGFQLKCPTWKHHSAIYTTIHRDRLETKHAHVSAWHLAYSPDAIPIEARNWLVSTAGHHGSYPSGFKKPARNCNEGVDTDPGVHPRFEQLRSELLSNIIETFGPLPTEAAKAQEIRTHLLTGFTIFADWIGSNTDWFPPDFPINPEAISTKTREILKDFGLPVPLLPNLTFSDLFTTNAAETFEPRPLQQALINAADNPGLYIVEAPMGTGKTEAALATAYRRWTEGEERGLYFALPTQLTSAKIHDRLESFLKAILDGPAFQSLIHGNAWLSDDRNRSLNQPDTEHNDTDEALRWFSSTRRQLLAPFGTGTIDQALLAILPARFAALRHFALAGKVVVIDEVHSYDPYMSALIDRLVEYLLPTGATVIILSATLTTARRAELIAAAGATEPSAPSAYPLITTVATGDSAATHIPVSDPSPEKSIELHHHTLTDESADTYWQSIADAVTAGANVVVIRNTVALAQQTFRLLKEKLNDSIQNEHTGLIHSRFTHTDRSENENNWIKILGKDSSLRPTGSLLVSTQIVEQSVDIDADLMVTDLAPVELILQRIGRLHRHPHARPTGFDTPRCHILHPPAEWGNKDHRVIETALTPHHFIYPPLALWQAAQTLSPRETISLPRDIRPLLESAAATLPDPDILQAFATFLPNAQQQLLAQQGTAKTRHVFATPANDKEGRETRYRIQPTAQLVLLKSPPDIRADSITLHPVHGDSITCPRHVFSFPLARALNNNSIRIPAYLVQNALKSSPDWLRQHLPDAALAVTHPDSAELELQSGSAIPYTFDYRNKLGLTWQKSNESNTLMTEPEDFWF